ncbi:MAG: MauE/DoxX family redox-associated membrane protein [Actinomycetota bacterium]
MLNGVSYCTGLLLAVVFAAAGIGKLSRPSVTVASWANLHLPFAKRLAVAVPVIELGLALLLVFRPPVGAVMSTIVISLFTVVLIRGMHLEPGATCACFGGFSERPISRSDLFRNGLLVGMAVFSYFSTPVLPSIEDIIVTSTVFLVGTVLVALVDLKIQVGHVWDNTLAGEVLP